MGAVHDYQKLDVWNLSREVALRSYAVTERFPAREIYSLADQIRRAASSVPANIAEGANRSSTRDFIRSLRIARGSAAEAHSHLCLARELGFIDLEGIKILSEINRVHCMLNALIGSLKRSDRKT